MPNKKVYLFNVSLLLIIVSPWPITGLLLLVSFQILSDNRRNLDFVL